VKFYGAVGYASSQETAPGVWADVMTEKSYYGDVISDFRRLVPTELRLNDDIALSNSFSLVADAYAIDNLINIRYIRWNGQVWTVTDVQVRRPRLIVQIGGLWNGNTA
jgi:hypothetical protein